GEDARRRGDDREPAEPARRARGALLQREAFGAARPRSRAAQAVRLAARLAREHRDRESRPRRRERDRSPGELAGAPGPGLGRGSGGLTLTEYSSSPATTGTRNERVATIVALTRGPRVLHVGCCNNRLPQTPGEWGDWVHQALVDVGFEVLGCDIDDKG